MDLGGAAVVEQPVGGARGAGAGPQPVEQTVQERAFDAQLRPLGAHVHGLDRHAKGARQLGAQGAFQCPITGILTG